MLNVKLNSDKAFDVRTPAQSERDLICVRDRPAKFVYWILKAGTVEEIANSVNTGHPLMFIIEYRMVEKGTFLGSQC